MKMLYLVSVFIHIICACIWLGGMFALIRKLLSWYGQ